MEIKQLLDQPISIRNNMKWYYGDVEMFRRPILNILARFHEKYGGEPDTVISGFHMMKKEAYTPAEREYILYTAAELEKMKHTLFITGHCTGEEAGNMMKSVMGDRLLFMHSGERLL